MKRDYRKWHSPALERDMELLVFGEGGTPVLVFPTSMGRFYQWEDFGMVAHMAERIDAGWLQLWCVDSVDAESFYDKKKAPQERAQRHLAYERYLVEEVLPNIRAENPVDFLIAVGASFGAFHALAFTTRRPGLARKAIGLSGAYDAARWLGGSREGEAYYVNPLTFLPNLSDDRYLRLYREHMHPILVVGGPADICYDGTQRLRDVLAAREIPHTLDVWEPAWHDWP